MLTSLDDMLSKLHFLLTDYINERLDRKSTSSEEKLQGHMMSTLKTMGIDQFQ